MGTLGSIKELQSHWTHLRETLKEDTPVFLSQHLVFPFLKNKLINGVSWAYFCYLLKEVTILTFK